MRKGVDIRIICGAHLLGLVALAAEVPKTWNDRALATWATPVAGLNVRPGHFSEREYYAAPIDNYRTYPVYLPDREPAGYWEWLQNQKPAPLIELAKPRTEAEWIRDGKRVFEELDAPAFRVYDTEVIARTRSKDEAKPPAARVLHDGTIAGLRWVVTPKGLAVNITNCSACHMRIMSNGSVLNGAPPNMRMSLAAVFKPVAGQDGFFLRRPPLRERADRAYRAFAVPWVKADIHEQFKTMDEPDFEELIASQISGTFARVNGSPFFVTKMPDLIGIGDRKYIDHTGTHRLRDIADFMRYAALVSGADSADFGPRMVTDEQRRIPQRYPDEVLYALAKYIYSLQPPANPNPVDERAAAGQKIFAREGCGSCHTPPLYTNNKLTVAQGFTPPKEHFEILDILNVSVGTDPNLALRTRKGTGYYKIPSLKGLWYRGLYLHDGSVASLEEMFDPERLNDQHVPGGFKGYKVKNRAIPGHEFGLKLNCEDRASLIAFLRTL